MSPKMLNFYALVWFQSILICIVLEGTYLGVHNTRSVINELSIMTTFNIGNLFTVPVFNINFFHGLFRVLTWDYSFYSGYYAFLRWFWLVVLTPGAVWGIASAFVWLYGQAINLFRLLPTLI